MHNVVIILLHLKLHGILGEQIKFCNLIQAVQSEADPVPCDEMSLKTPNPSFLHICLGTETSCSFTVMVSSP